MAYLKFIQTLACISQKRQLRMKYMQTRKGGADNKIRIVNIVHAYTKSKPN